MPHTRFVDMVSSPQFNATLAPIEPLEEPPPVKDLWDIPGEENRHSPIPVEVITVEEKSPKGKGKKKSGRGNREGVIMTSALERSPFEDEFAAATPVKPDLARGAYGSAILLDGGATRWDQGAGTPVRIEESGGRALARARHAMYDNHRLADGRFMWILPVSLLTIYSLQGIDIIYCQA